MYLWECVYSLFQKRFHSLLQILGKLYRYAGKLLSWLKLNIINSYYRVSRICNLFKLVLLTLERLMIKFIRLL